jgi:hypothetical protein
MADLVKLDRISDCTFIQPSQSLFTVAVAVADMRNSES